MILDVCGVNNTLLRVTNATPSEMDMIRFTCSGEVGKYQKGQNGWHGRVEMAWYIAPYWYVPANCWRRLMALNEPDVAARRPAYNVVINGLDELTNPDILPETVQTFVESLNPPFEDVQDQIDLMYTVLRERYTTNHVATGFGKTYQCYLLSEWNKSVYSGKALIIVPRTGLVDQGIDDFRKYHNTENEQLKIYGIAGGIKNNCSIDEADVIIGTYQSLINMPDDWFLNISMLLVDEAHMGKAASIVEITKKCQNSMITLGVSGTMSYLTAADSITVEAYIGPLTAIYKVFDQVKKGRLPDVAVQPIELKLHADGELYKAILAAKGLRHVQNLDISLASSYRRAEIEYITTSKYVHDWLLSYCNSYTSRNMNILVIFKNVPPVLTFFDYANANGAKCHMIFGATPRHVRKEIKQQIERESGWILVATDGTMSMGESINNLHGGISMCIGHSPHITLQAIGRQLRNHKTKMMTTVLSDIYVNLDNVLAYTTSYDVKDHKNRMGHYKNESYPIRPLVTRNLGTDL